MDTRTGEIKTLTDEIRGMLTEEEKKHIISMKLPPTNVQMLRRPPRVGRNEPCPCGSGKKFKHCHLEITVE